MDAWMKVYAYAQAHLNDLVDLVAYAVLVGSVIVKLTPTLKDDNYFKGIVRFVGKYIALDKYGPPKEG